MCLFICFNSLCMPYLTILPCIHMPCFSLDASCLFTCRVWLSSCTLHIPCVSLHVTCLFTCHVWLSSHKYMCHVSFYTLYALNLFTNLIFLWLLTSLTLSHIKPLLEVGSKFYRRGLVRCFLTSWQEGLSVHQTVVIAKFLKHNFWGYNTCPTIIVKTSNNCQI